MKNHFSAGAAALLIATCVIAAPASAGKKAVKNIATVYTTETSGGSGLVKFPLPVLPPGFYQVSFTANFRAQGTPTAPVTFTCNLIYNDKMQAQSTATSTSTQGFSPGVNGLIAIEAALGDQGVVNCGRLDSDWLFNTRPLAVTVLRIDGVSQVTIP